MANQSRTASLDDHFDRVDKSHCYNFTFIAIVMSTAANFSWLTYYSVTALPGNSLSNGIILGLAELSASFCSGFFLKIMTDR